MSATTTQQPSTGNGSFQQRALTATITLGQGTFGNSGFNTVTLSGLRAAATIHKMGAPSFDTAEMRIYGVTPDVGNAVSTLGVPLPMFRYNTLVIQAGDLTNGMTTMFAGWLVRAWQDFDEAPETFLHLIAYGGINAAMVPAEPISYPGGADVATIMSGLATKLGIAFENNGVQVQLASPYFPGTAASAD